MGILIDMKAKHQIRKELEDLGELQKNTCIFNVDTPRSDIALAEYLRQSIAWLDELDDEL